MGVGYRVKTRAFFRDVVRLPKLTLCLCVALDLFAAISYGAGIEFTQSEREHLDLALRAMNASVADLGFKKDVGEPRSVLQWVREALENPLTLNRVGEELWTATQSDDVESVWTFIAERLEVGPRPDDSGLSAEFLSPDWPGASPELSAALDTFYSAIQPAESLLRRACAELSPEEMDYLAASTLSSALNLEDEEAARDAMRAAGIDGKTLDEMLTASKELDETPAAERVLAAAAKIDRAALLTSGRIFQQAVYAFAETARSITNWPEKTTGWDSPLGRIVYADETSSVISNRALLLVSPRGNTTYRGEAGSAGFNRTPFAAIVDIEGDDVYRGDELLGPGSALFGVAVVVDFSGSDTWRSDYIGPGAGLWGVGWVEDYEGDDIYESRVLSQGAAVGGVGVLIDCAGNDSYSVGWQGQGFAGWMGFGLLLDRAGADRYFAGGRELDHERNPDRYLSLSQGFSIGNRPFAGGGIGALVDLEGNDVYDADVFAQGVSYYYSAGFLLDGAGHDRYAVHHYGQGCGIHLSLGLLVDFGGDDFYKGGTLAQGAAHDFAVGGLLDRAGNDTYIATQNSQGHGMNNSVGWLLDAAGDDVYEGRDSDSTQGIGNTGGSRESGSIGLLLDLGGTDRYSSPGVNGRLLLRPNYGVIYDVNSAPAPEEKQ